MKPQTWCADALDNTWDAGKDTAEQGSHVRSVPFAAIFLRVWSKLQDTLDPASTIWSSSLKMQSANAGQTATRDRGYFLALCAAFVLAAVAYNFVFEIDTRPEYQTLGPITATRLYLLDSDVYSHLYGTQRHPLSLGSLVDDYLNSYTRNHVGPAIVSTLISSLGFGLVYFNILITIISAWLMRLSCKELNVGARLPIALILINPMTVYYSQTETKEILLLFMSALFLYCIVAKTQAVRVAFAAAAAATIGHIAVRAQTVVPAAVALVFKIFASSRGVVWWRRGFFLFTLTLPLAYRYGLLTNDNLLEYRDNAPSVTGMGPMVDQGMQSVPMFGVVGIPLRFLQNALEPFPNDAVFVDGPGTVSIAGLMSVICVFLASYSCFGFVRRVFHWLRSTGTGYSISQASTLVYLATFSVLVAATPFVHGRYLFNLLPWFAVGAQIRPSDEPAGVAVISTEIQGSMLTKRIWFAWAVAYGALLARAWMA